MTTQHSTRHSMLQVGDLLVDSDGFPAYVFEFRHEWLIGRYSDEPKPIIADASGSGFYDLDRYTFTGLLVGDVATTLCKLFPNYAEALDRRLHVPWLKLSWEQIQGLMRGDRFSCHAEDLSALHPSDVLLFATFFDFEVNFETAMAWYWAIEGQYRSITPQQARILLNEERFWANRWCDGKRAYNAILWLCNLEPAFVWHLDYVADLL